MMDLRGENPERRIAQDLAVATGKPALTDLLATIVDVNNNVTNRGSTQVFAPMLWKGGAGAGGGGGAQQAAASRFPEGQVNGAQVTGFCHVVFSWDNLFENVLPEYVERVDLVLGSPRVNFTLRIDSGSVVNVGWGDLHSGTLDRFRRTASVSAGQEMTLTARRRRRAAPRAGCVAAAWMQPGGVTDPSEDVHPPPTRRCTRPTSCTRRSSPPTRPTSSSVRPSSAPRASPCSCSNETKWSRLSIGAAAPAASRRHLLDPRLVLPPLRLLRRHHAPPHPRPHPALRRAARAGRPQPQAPGLPRHGAPRHRLRPPAPRGASVCAPALRCGCSVRANPLPDATTQVSNELHVPAAAIIGAASLLGARGPLSEEQRDVLPIVSEGATQARKRAGPRARPPAAGSPSGVLSSPRCVS